jgi:hypothetical protein
MLSIFKRRIFMTEETRKMETTRTTPESSSAERPLESPAGPFTKLGADPRAAASKLFSETPSELAVDPMAVATPPLDPLMRVREDQRARIMELFNAFQSERELDPATLRIETEEMIKGKTPSFFWDLPDYIAQSGYIEKLNEAAERIGRIPTQLRILYTPNCYDKEGNLLPEEALNKILGEYGLVDENAYSVSDHKPTTDVRFYSKEAIKVRGGSQFPNVYFETLDGKRRDVDIVQMDYYMDRAKTLHTFYHETCHVLQAKDCMLRGPIFSAHGRIEKLGKETQANFYANMYLALQMLQCGRLTQDMVNILVECSSCNPINGYNDIVMSHHYLTDMLVNPQNYLNNRDFFLDDGELNIEGIYRCTREIVREQQTQRYENYFNLHPELVLGEDKILLTWFLVDCLNDSDELSTNPLNPSELEQLQIFLAGAIAEAQRKGMKLSEIPKNPRDITQELCLEILRGENQGQTFLIPSDGLLGLIDTLGRREKFELYKEKHSAKAKIRSESEKGVWINEDPQNPATQDMKKGRGLELRGDYFFIKLTQHDAVSFNYKILSLRHKIAKTVEGERKQRLEREQKSLEEKLERNKVFRERQLVFLERRKREREAQARLEQLAQEAQVVRPEPSAEPAQGKPGVTDMQKQAESLEKTIGQIGAVGTGQRSVGGSDG